jgi:hypothetical protein
MNSAAVNDVIGRLAHDEIAATKVGRDHLVETVDIAPPGLGQAA